jgi:hypothetical protein
MKELLFAISLSSLTRTSELGNFLEIQKSFFTGLKPFPGLASSGVERLFEKSEEVPHFSRELPHFGGTNA